MTDDLVKRLRGPYEWRSIATQWGNDFYDETPLEAADEIERLRQKVESLRLLAEHHHDIGEDLALARGDNERLLGLLTDVVDAWDWWQVDTYDRCASVPADAINAARAALSPPAKEPRS